jgi:hypothetical protein
MADAAAVSQVMPICTDRPTRANGSCTVDAGHFQYEGDVVSDTVLRLDGVRTETLLVINPTLKYGLTSDLDIEANVSPAEIVRTRAADGERSTTSGVSDLVLRLKYEFLNVGGGNLQAALIPYVKAPTAKPGIGNGEVEDGVLAPINYKLGKVFTLTALTEVDDLLNPTGTGRHLNVSQLMNLAASLPENVTLYAELWADRNFEPAGVVREYSADFAVALGVTPRLQLDAGMNAGLNRYTPATQVYVGVSQKF